MIKINNLRKELDRGVVALDNISIEIHDQEFITLLRPSGYGKSTTLNRIAGLLDITSGEILSSGEDVTEKAPKDRNTDMMFQSYMLYPHLKAIDSIAFPLKQRSMGKEEYYQKAREMAKKLQVEHLLDKRPARLSDGQQQRVVMYRALVKGPKVLLLDELMPNLDTRLKIEAREVTKTIQQELKVTSIIATHDQEEVMAATGWIAILDNGSIQQYDTPGMLYECPANPFVISLMGNPPMNFIDAVAEEQDGGCVYVIGNCQISVSDVTGERMEMHVGKKVELGVHPHQMTVEREPPHGALPIKVQMVENLGKELLVTGGIGESHIRIALNDTSRFQELKEEVAENGVLYARLADKINVSNEKTKVNLVLREHC